MKKKPIVKYMHTIGVEPAQYIPGKQIVFATVTRPITLCESLAQIKRERRASRSWRKKRGCDDVGKFGHVRVIVG